VKLRLEAERGEVLPEQARGGLLVPRRVLGVDAEETLEERDGLALVDTCDRLGHRGALVRADVV
jgi:hypothetical protein